jgi:hypothetical protein
LPRRRYDSGRSADIHFGRFDSHDPLELHFGLGDADRVDDIVVCWPPGLVQRLGAQRARQRITITESSG